MCVSGVCRMAYAQSSKERALFELWFRSVPMDPRGQVYAVGNVQITARRRCRLHPLQTTSLVTRQRKVDHGTCYSHVFLTTLAGSVISARPDEQAEHNCRARAN